MSNSDIQTFLRIASDLRHSDPRSAAEIVKAVRNLRASDQDQDQGQSTPPQQVGISEEDMDDFVSGEIDMGELEDETDKLINSEDLEAFVNGLQDISEVLKKRKASRFASHIATSEADFSDVQESLDSMDGDKKKKLFNDLVGQSKELKALLKKDDIADFMTALDELLSDTKAAAQNVKTSSIRVSLSALARLATDIPSSRGILLPILAAAKKKKDKKKDKKDKKSATKKKAPKKDPKKDSKKNKDVPFGGKKAPPFGKKKASVDVSTADSEW